MPQIRTDEIMMAVLGGESGPPVAFPPSASFKSDVTSGDAPLTVQFTDQSSGNPHTWAWGFGDTGSSTQQNPSHVYADLGVYTVSLTVTNDEGSDTETKNNYITVAVLPVAPVAAFSGLPLSGASPLEVQFTDASTNTPTSWAWTFGDGGTSTAQNPLYEYAIDGDYTVSLTATNAGGSDIETKVDYISASASLAFPPWEENVNNVPAFLTALNDLSVSSVQAVSTFGNLVGAKKWYGAVCAPNGNIYAIPRDSTTVLKVDTSDDSTSTFGNLVGETKWFGGTIGPDGSIYGMPFNSLTVLKINTTNDSATTFGTVPSVLSQWYGGVLAPNGCIYGIPFNGTQILKIDTLDNDAITFFGSFSGNGKWIGGVLDDDNNIYAIPHNSTTVLKINTTNDSTSTFGSLSGPTKWAGGAIGPDGSIYGIPHSSTTVLKINTTNDSTSTFGSLIGTLKWVGGALAPDKNIYGIPHNSSVVLKIDTSDDSTSTFGTLGGDSAKWAGGALSPNGSIYGVPRESLEVIKILTGDPVDENFPLHRIANKL